MNYREFGNKGFKISEIVFGAGAVGGLIIRKDPDTRHQAFEEALKLGINWVDTAPAYGDGLSEQHLGEILPSFSDYELYISSKIQIRQEHLSDISGTIKKSLEKGSFRKSNCHYAWQHYKKCCHWQGSPTEIREEINIKKINTESKYKKRQYPGS